MLKFSDGSSPEEFEDIFNKMQKEKLNSRVAELEGKGMSKHEALTQAGLERESKEGGSKNFKKLSVDEKIIVAELRSDLEEKFSPDVADKLAMRIVDDVAQLPDADLKDEVAISEVIKETVKSYGKEHSNSGKVENRVNELLAKGIDKHSALMQAGQELLL